MAQMRLFGIKMKKKNRQNGKRMWLVFCACFFLMICCRPVASAEKRDAGVTPSLLALLRSAVPKDFCGERVPWKNPEVRERFEKEFLLSVWNSPQVLLWLKRSKRYLPYMEKTLKESGLPDDLKYVAVAESGLRPHVGSKKGAMGFWQFTPATGRNYGLVVDGNRDDRRNVFLSTNAAVLYFRELHQEFGSWTLSAAAYNMGEKGLMAEILEQGTENYYDLYLPLETQRFLFRILAIKLILQQPEKFGFSLKKEDYYAPFVFDRVRVKAEKEVPLRIIAKAANGPFKEIKDLNPEIRGHYLPAGDHEISIPKGSAKGFQKRLALLLKGMASEEMDRIYVVQKGDNLSSIAARFNVPVAALIIWNRIDLKSPIHPGQRLIVSSGRH